MGKKKEPEGAPAWIVTFADLMSLLLTFFVLLLSFAKTDEHKFNVVTGSIKEAFGVQTVAFLDRKPSSTTFIENNYAAGGKEWEEMVFNQSKLGIEFESFCALEEQKAKREKEELRIISEKLIKKIKERELESKISVHLDKKFLELRLKYADYFASQKTAWKQGGAEQLRLVLSLIESEQVDTKVFVASHSPRQINSSNVDQWSLSAQRSLRIFGYAKSESYEYIKEVGQQDSTAKSYKDSMDYFNLKVALASSTD